MSLSCSPEECAFLHNQLLHKISQHVPLTIGILAEEFLDVATALEIPNVEETPFYHFLRLCETYRGPNGEEQNALPLTPQVSQPDPYHFFSEYLQDDNEHPFLILLYPAHNGASHMKDLETGLLLDRFTFRAHWHCFPGRIEPEHH